MIIATDVWKEFGYNSIVYLAAITAIDPGLHEAAAMDGATWWKRVWHITLPGMLPIILLMAAMSLTSILSAGFDQIYNLYSPMVYKTGDVLDTYVYRMGLISRQYSFSTAVGLLRSVVGLILMVYRPENLLRGQEYDQEKGYYGKLRNRGDLWDRDSFRAYMPSSYAEYSCYFVQRK